MTDLLTPRDGKDVAAAVAEAAAASAPLAVAGNGTKAAIGRPVQAARTLSTAALTGVTLYEPAEMVIGARPGTPLAEVERTLAERGQELSFEPLDYRVLLGGTAEPTIGGVVGGGLSGPRRIQVGACRDSLIGVTLVNGRGETIRSGGRVMKNVTGLDFVKLSAGSWGTLGVFTEVIFKVSPRAETAATLVLHGLDDRRGLAALAAGLGSPFEVSGAAHLPAPVERVPKTLLRLEGFAPSIAYRVGEMRALLKPFGAADVLEGEPSAALWRAVRDAAMLAGPRETAIWRVSIAATKAAAAMAALAGGVVSRYVYDWGGGLIWLATSAEGDAGAAAIRAALAGTGGHATLIRAPADLRAAVDVFEPQPEPLRRIAAGIKAAFDPRGILNPGRMAAGV